MIVIRAIKDDGVPSLWDIIAVLPLGLNPYFLECLSYKFDSPYMALSVLASVFPLVLRNRSRLVYLGSVGLCAVAICTTYQAATGIFPMAVMMVALLDWLRGGETRDSLRFIGISAAAYLAGLLVFRVFIMVPVEAYVSNSITDLPGVIQHYRSYFELIISDCKPGWLMVVVTAVFAFIFVATIMTEKQKVFGLIVTSACIVAMAMAMFGLYPLLASPLFATRAMYGWGAFVAFILVAGVNAYHPTRMFPGFLSLMLAWSFIGFACTYGNALAVQQNWEDYRRSEFLYDLTELPEFINGEQRVVEIRGNVGLSPTLTGAVNATGVLSRLIPQTLQGSWAWGIQKLQGYYGLPNCQFKLQDSGADLNVNELLHESVYHRIYGGDGYFIVELL